MDDNRMQAVKGFLDTEKVRLNFLAKILKDDLKIFDFDFKEGSTTFALRPTYHKIKLLNTI